jgi:uncharacterized protein
LQHYNPLVDEKTKTQWGLDPEWSLKAQLVFGQPTGGPNEKTSKPLEGRVKVFGA